MNSAMVYQAATTIPCRTLRTREVNAMTPCAQRHAGRHPRSSRGTFLLLLLLCTLPACSLVEIRTQSQRLGNASTIQGTVTSSASRKGPVVVALYRFENNICMLKTMMQASARGQYRFWVDQGRFAVAAFVDANHDGVFQWGEPWNYVDRPVEVVPSQAKALTLEALSISDTQPVLPAMLITGRNLSSAAANLGKVVGLDDAIFSADNYTMGMWRPLDFLARIGGGLFFLQEYRHDRVPVIFFHGINGGPTDFAPLIDHLDRSRFQPWVIYYPSGLMLDVVSEYLVSDIITLQNRYRFDRFIIVGHSMGGLVARSFVKKYVEEHPERLNNLVSVMTINSPLGGMPSAAVGARAPIMVQSWRDVAPESDFLRDINSWSWPAAIPYYLIFSSDGGGGDGVVPLKQQLPLKQQRDAARMYGFFDSHVGTLRNPAFLELFASLLRQGYRQPHSP